jgi:hypothetical protein
VKLLDAEKEVIKAMIIVNNDYQQLEQSALPPDSDNTNNNNNNSNTTRKSKSKRKNQNSPQEYHTRLSLFITQQQLNNMKSGSSSQRDSIIERTRNPFAQLIEEKYSFLQDVTDFLSFCFIHCLELTLSLSLSLSLSFLLLVQTLI